MESTSKPFRSLASIATLLILLSSQSHWANLLAVTCPPRNVALNRIGGAWDQDLLARLLIDLRATDQGRLREQGFQAGAGLSGRAVGHGDHL